MRLKTRNTMLIIVKSMAMTCCIVKIQVFTTTYKIRRKFKLRKLKKFRQRKIKYKPKKIKSIK